MNRAMCDDESLAPGTLYNRARYLSAATPKTTQADNRNAVYLVARRESSMYLPLLRYVILSSSNLAPHEVVASSLTLYPVVSSSL